MPVCQRNKTVKVTILFINNRQCCCGCTNSRNCGKCENRRPALAAAPFAVSRAFHLPVQISYLLCSLAYTAQWSMAPYVQSLPNTTSSTNFKAASFYGIFQQPPCCRHRFLLQSEGFCCHEVRKQEQLVHMHPLQLYSLQKILNMIS